MKEDNSEYTTIRNTQSADNIGATKGWGLHFFVWRKTIHIFVLIHTITRSYSMTLKAEKSKHWTKKKTKATGKEVSGGHKLHVPHERKQFTGWNSVVLYQNTTFAPMFHVWDVDWEDTPISCADFCIIGIEESPWVSFYLREIHYAKAESTHIHRKQCPVWYRKGDWFQIPIYMSSSRRYRRCGC